MKRSALTTCGQWKVREFFLSWWVATLNKHHAIPLTTLGPLLCVWTLQYCYITHSVCFKVFTWNLLTCQHVLTTWSGFVCSANQHPKSTVKRKKAHKPLCILWFSPKTCLSRLIIIQSCYYSGREAPSHKMGSVVVLFFHFGVANFTAWWHILCCLLITC